MLQKETLAYLSKKIERCFDARVKPEKAKETALQYKIKLPRNAQDLLVGTILADKYYVLSVLGFGGMSVVYKAKEKARRVKIVAIKTLRVNSLSDQRTVMRFKREAELLGHLNHPRIVQVSDYGTTKRGQPYFVMDYLKGISLSQFLKEGGPLSPSIASDIFSQVCGAVDHAHRCGVVHRDLKAGNIMLIKQDDQPYFVKVVDFGIARFEEDAQRLTRIGEVWGSPIYMSPEQCMGAQLDQRSDIYSLGVVMYEMLTGMVPFLGKNYVETMSLQINTLPPTFAQAGNDTCPKALEKIVMKALAKEPDKRYQSMAELRIDLEKANPKPVRQIAQETIKRVEARQQQRLRLKRRRQRFKWRSVIWLLLIAYLYFLLLSALLRITIWLVNTIHLERLFAL